MLSTSGTIKSASFSSATDSTFAPAFISSVTGSAFSTSGTTELEIRQEFGETGIKHLQELIDHGILLVKDERIFGQSSKVTFNQKIMKQAVLHSIEQCYDPQYFGKGENWLSLQTESVNKEKALPEIRNILQNAYKEIKEVLYSEEFKGEDKIFVSMVLDKIISTDKSEGILQ